MRNQKQRLLVALAALVLGLLAAFVMPSHAQQEKGFAGTTLVMVDAPDCAYCRKWDREVSKGYGLSPEGRAAPLTRVRRGDRRLADMGGLAYTPTFILIVNGQEAGRIVGYAGSDFFWGQLNQIIQRVGFVF
jgi:hypothetical protein